MPAGGLKGLSAMTWHLSLQDCVSTRDRSPGATRKALQGGTPRLRHGLPSSSVQHSASAWDALCSLGLRVRLWRGAKLEKGFLVFLSFFFF